MALFKCKMCGGTLEINNNESVATCEYCGTQQTLPKLDDDRKANMYDRANHFRRNNEFDKAATIYENLLNEDSTDAEAYWSLVLCRYGIEYVEDPFSHKRVPTVNRTQYTSIFDDDNYKSALKHAYEHQRSLYEKEAKAINEIQKGILAISQKEEPFDVFICYKETDNSGKRTQDSVLANDLYHQLTQEGFKVFFARITLEDKLGSAYEPYIFAALNSAKVMVVLGTKPEFFNAVWVKNEWSRYLTLIKSGEKKMLIPAYKDMDPYDLPEEFSHLQAQDMSKLGFMQDLIRGIKKIVQFNEPNKTVIQETVSGGSNSNTAPLIKRAFIFLEDGNWSSADEYCEKVLDSDPENAEAYLGKLMAELRVKKQEHLFDCSQPFDDRNNYKKAVRFGNDTLKTALKEYIAHINVRNENMRLEGIYNKAIEEMNSAKSEDAYKKVANIFSSILEYKDSAEMKNACLEKADICYKENIYSLAKSNMIGFQISQYETAIRQFEFISGWKDADEQILSCKRKIEEIKAKDEADRIERERRDQRERQEEEKRERRNRKIKMVITFVILAVCIMLAYQAIQKHYIIPNGKYKDAIMLSEQGKYIEAYESLIALNGYKDSEDKANAIYEKYEEEKTKGKYNDAIALLEAGEYIEAYETLITLNGYKDSEDKANSIFEKYKEEKMKNPDVGDFIYFGTYEQDNNTANGKEEIEWLVLAKENNKLLVISRYALDSQKYNVSDRYATWEISSLREWMNDSFINEAFNPEEQTMVQITSVSADVNPSYSAVPGNDTMDKVFLLSVKEANKYFSDSNARCCEGTAYAAAQGADIGEGNKCLWWLRTPGYGLNYASVVQCQGDIDCSGYIIDDEKIAVRPALWITITP